jgi:3-oxoacyl-[acyl-carrier protein] reductase
VKKSSQVVVVTGAASNIGLAVARRFLKDTTVIGLDVMFGDPQKAALVAGEGNHKFIGLSADVSNPDSVRSALIQARSYGSIVAVVHCAAITSPPVSIRDMSYPDWERLLNINLTGTFVIIKESSSFLIESGGSAVLLTSRAGKVGYAGLVPYAEGTKAHYAASKAGVISLVKSAALELAQYGVRINAIAPGSIEGAMIPKDRWTLLAQKIPLSRLGTPDEIANAASFLCSKDASYITGHTLDVNGGTLMD